MLANRIRGIIIACYVMIGLILLWPVLHATKERINDEDEANILAVCMGTCFHIVLLSLLGTVLARYKAHSSDIRQTLDNFHQETLDANLINTCLDPLSQINFEQINTDLEEHYSNAHWVTIFL